MYNEISIFKVDKVMITVLTLITYFLFAVIIVLGVLFGFKRGLGRSVVRVVYMAVLIPVSYFLGRAVANPISDKLIRLITNSKNKVIHTIVEGSPETAELLHQMARVLVIPLLFALLYGLFEALSYILFNRISSAVLNKVRKGKEPVSRSRLLGGLIGLGRGLVVSTILLIPLCMVITVVSTSDPAALASLKVPGFKSGDKQVAMATSPVAVLASNRILYPMTMVPADTIPEEYAELRDSGICVMQEAPYIINAVGNAKQTYSDATKAKSDKSIAVIKTIGAINSSVGDSKVLPAVVAYIIRVEAKEIKKSDTIFGFDYSNSNELTKQLLHEMLAVLEEVNSENVNSILSTLTGDGDQSGALENVVTIMKNTNSGETIRQNADLFSETLVDMGKSNDLKQINSIVSQIGIQYLNKSGMSLFSDETPDEKKKQMFDTVADTINRYYDEISVNIDAFDDGGKTYEQCVNNLSQVIIDATKDENYTITEDEAIIVSVGLISYFEGHDEVTAEGLMEYIGLSDEEIARINTTGLPSGK